MWQQRCALTRLCRVTAPPWVLMAVDMQGIAEQLAGQGYVAVNIEYRFALEYRFSCQLHDLQQAMVWIHANADEWQVNTNRIVGVGIAFLNRQVTPYPSG